ncbi:MAG: hypothetical protein WC223_05355 [Bacteroidales bacterium]|jgi:hypothetical protein
MKYPFLRMFKSSKEKPISLKGELLCREYIEYNKICEEKHTKEMMETTLIKGCDVLKEIGVKYWLGKGTLLGFHRENDFLSTDLDIDVDIYTDKDVYKIIKSMPFDVLFVTSNNNNYMQLAFLDKETNVIFDIYFWYLSNDKIINRCCYGYFWLPFDKIDNLSHITYNGKNYPAPNPDWYCEFWYGENWKTPVKYEKGWHEYYKNECKGLIYTGTKNIRYLKYFNE